MRRWAGLLAAVITLLLVAPAHACSVRNYRTPSNFELVHRADLIVLARVVAGPDRRVELAPIRVLKGVHAGEPLRLLGRLGLRNGPLAPSPTPLRAPHFSVWSGSCVRTLYSEGALVVALFRRVPEGLYLYGEPFARAVEDVEGENGIWVRAVREYLGAQRGVTASALRSAGERLRTRLAARRGDLAAQAMAEDLRVWLDETAPGGPIRRRATVWRWTGGTEGAGATLSGAAPQPTAGFRCAPGESRLRIDLEGADGVPQLALVIGGRRFDAEGEARQTLRGGARAASGYIPVTPRLAALMRSSTAPAGIAADGRTLLVAPPADILQKLAVGCVTAPGRPQLSPSPPISRRTA